MAWQRIVLHNFQHLSDADLLATGCLFLCRTLRRIHGAILATDLFSLDGAIWVLLDRRKVLSFYLLFNSVLDLASAKNVYGLFLYHFLLHEGDIVLQSPRLEMEVVVP